LDADAQRYTVICEPDVMSSFLLLCKHIGTAYRIDDFITQASAVLGRIENAKGNWLGTDLAARTAAKLKSVVFALSRSTSSNMYDFVPGGHFWGRALQERIAGKYPLKPMDRICLK
jgi:hypothetical protein